MGLLSYVKMVEEFLKFGNVLVTFKKNKKNLIKTYIENEEKVQSTM